MRKELNAGKDFFTASDACIVKGGGKKQVGKWTAAAAAYKAKKGR